MAPPISKNRPPVVAAPPKFSDPVADTKPKQAAPVDTFEYPKGSPELKKALDAVNAWRSETQRKPVTMAELPKALAEFQRQNGIDAARPGKLDLPTRERMWILERPEYRKLSSDERTRVRDFLKDGKNGQLVLDALQQRGMRADDVFRLAADPTFANADPGAIATTFTELKHYAQAGLPAGAADNLVDLVTSPEFPTLTASDQNTLLQLQQASPEDPGPRGWLVRALPHVQLDPAIRQETMAHLQKFAKKPEALSALSLVATHDTYKNMPVNVQRVTLALLDRHSDDPGKIQALRDTFLSAAFGSASPADQLRMMKRSVGE